MDVIREMILVEGYLRTVPLDKRPVRGKIYARRNDSRGPLKDLLIQPDAGRAANSIDQKVGFFDFAVTPDKRNKRFAFYDRQGNIPGPWILEGPPEYRTTSSRAFYKNPGDPLRVMRI